MNETILRWLRFFSSPTSLRNPWDIANLARELGIQFTEHEHAFDLDRANPPLQGTYRKIPAGIEAAYGDLMRFRLLSRERQGPTTDHLALDCQFLPSSTASFLKALIAYLNDQTDPTGLKIYNLREMAKSLRMTYDRIDGLLGILA